MLLLGVVAGPSASAQEAALSWPLRIAPALSSTFGESRSRAFHAGIDLKTWGATGHPIQALADGYIWRARTSPWGYGRALYQKLADGRTVVYAHLERFAAPVAERVAQAQKQRGRYSVDLHFEAGEIPVLGGAVIAWSGESGAGPPHLHLELRDADNVAINPLLHGFSIADTIAPTVQRVAIAPHGRTAQVEGGHDPYVLRLGWQQGEFIGERTVQVRSPVSISALMYDRADAAPNKLAPYRTALYVDGAPVFAARYERVGYGDMHQMYLDRPLAAFKGGVSRFYNLCRLPGNRLEFYEGPGDGMLNLAKGLHEAVVEVADVNGNESRARFRLMVDEPPALAGARIATEADGIFIEAELTDADDPLVEVELASSRDGQTWRRVDRRQSRAGPLKWRIHRNASYWRIRARDPAGVAAFAICRLPDDGAAAPSFSLDRRPHPDFVELVLRYAQVPSAAPLVRAGTANINPRQTGLREFRAVVPLEPSDPAAGPVLLRAGKAAVQKVALDRQAVTPGAAAELLYANGTVELGFAAASAYAPFFPQVVAFEPQVPAALVEAGPAFALGPEISFDHKVELRLRYDRGTLPPEKLGIYREVAPEKWTLVSNEWDAGSRQVVARVRRFGRYALLADLEAPQIGGLQPAAGAVVGPRPQIRGAVRDAGSGIGREEDIEFELDGRPLIAEYDPEAGRVYGHWAENLPPGAHRLVLRVRDMSGNQAEIRSEFTVR